MMAYRVESAINADVIPAFSIYWNIPLRPGRRGTVKKYGSRLFELLQRNTGATSDARRVLKSF